MVCLRARLVLPLLILIAGSAGTAAAQETTPDLHTLILRDVPLSEALGRLVELTQISLLYGPELDRAAPVFCAARDEPPEAILRCIVASAGKDFYRLSSGTYVVIEPAEAPPQLGSLAGSVVCAETGEPLPYAHVFLADASAGRIGTAANEAGLFVLSDLLPGTHRLVASYVGYTPAAARVEVLPNGQVRRRIALRPEPVAALPVVIDGIELMPVLGQVIEDADANEPIQRATDPPALGLSVRPLTGRLHIQGGEAGEHQVRLDGVPVFEPMALARLFGAFDPLAVERVAVHKAGFGASQGSFTSGVVEMDHGLAPGLSVTADPYAVGGRVGQRFTTGSRDVAVMAAGRVGLWDVWRMPVVDRLLRDWNAIDPLLMAEATTPGAAPSTFAPHRRGSDLGLTDVHGAARVRLDPFRTVRVSGFHSDSRVGTDLFALTGAPQAPPDRVALTRDDYAWANSAGRVHFSTLLGARALASVQVRASRHASHQAYAMTERRDLPESTDFAALERELADLLDATAGHGNRSRMREVAAEARLDLSLASGRLLEVGIEAAHADHDFALGGPFYRPIETADAAWRVAAFAQDRWTLGAFTLESGVRLTGVPQRRTVYAEPRLAVRYDAERSPVGPASVRLAGGLYRQFVVPLDVTAVGPSALVPSVRFWMPIDASLAPPTAWHSAAEVVVAPRPGWTARAELYHKHLPRLLALDYPAILAASGPVDEAVTQQAFIGAARGFAYGGGVRIERATERLRARLGYDYSVSRRTFPSRFDGGTQPTPWNEPHRVFAATDVTLVPGLVARAQARGVWGRTWGYRQAYYDVLAVHGVTAVEALGLPETATLPPLAEFDLGLGYGLSVAGTRIEATADLLNVLDRVNVLDYGVRTNGDTLDRVPRTLLGRHAVVSIRFTR